MTVYALGDPLAFPDPNEAEDAVGGLIAIGGNLSERRLLEAYRAGIFPWYENDSEPILWWSPNPRAVLEPGAMRVNRSLAKRLRNAGFGISFDRAFPQVIESCATVHRKAAESSGTWITPNMRRAYCGLHTSGYAHSVEVWLNGELAGGLYGLALGEMFFAESMFYRVRDASKVALYHLGQRLEVWGFRLIDCQLPNKHLTSLGVESIPRQEFLALLAENDESKTRWGNWSREAN